MEFLRFAVQEIVGDEFHFADLVVFPAFGGFNDPQKFPVHRVNGFLELFPEISGSGVGVGGLVEVVAQAEEIGAVAGAHQLLGGFRFGPTIVIRHAAFRIAETALAGAERFFPLAGNVIFLVDAHCDILRLATIRSSKRCNLPLPFSMLPRILVFAFLNLPVFVIAEEKIDFSRDIRPLLSDRCFKCHGFDDESREADLGLHTFEQATRDLGGYRAITPGDVSASEIIARLTSNDPDELMPPPAANKPKFSPEEVAKVKQWIEEGAEYEQLWSLKKPEKETVPDPDKAIDFFIDQELAKKKLAPNPGADAFTLIRRLSLDLTGLPPTVAETSHFVEAFQTDPVSAYSDAVDRLLASPAYGEKWARDWLDLARYADTNGYEKDRERSIWPWRDWVIKALNADMPYDQFTIEQLAGDMLSDATLDQIVATGFHRNTMLNEEGGIDPLEFRYHAMVDRVATTGVVWMGLTTGCAQCHTHKFDPITHTDYFAMMALLGNADEPEIEVPDPEARKKREAIQEKIDELEQKAVKDLDPAAYGKWLAAQEKRLTDWIPLRPVSMKSTMPLLELVPEDLSIFASGDFTKRDVYELGFDLSPLKGKEITAIRLEVIPDDRLPAKGPGAAYYEGRKGDFFLSEMSVSTDQGKMEFADTSVSFGKISVGSGDAKGSNVIDGDGSTGWSTSTEQGKRHELVMNTKSPLAGAKMLNVKLLFERHFVAGLGRFRISVTSDSEKAVATAHEIPNPATATEEEMKLAFVRHSPSLKALQEEVAKLEASKPQYPLTLVMKERPENNFRETKYHHRGEYLQAKHVVEPAVPAVFQPISDEEPKNRLSFAKWLVSERNPLVARVVVNRAWRSFFGRGLVFTSGDYGYQSELPSHPELLDWLAVDFVENGWSLKQLHRKIVLSEAYQRGSHISPEQLERDPENVWLARGPRVRLSGETIRDSVLQASGLLTQKVGGPSVFPPQPESVTKMGYGNNAWKTSEGADRYRRSLYTFSKRTTPFAAYLAFDGPTGESCLPRRESSNTPLQALTLLNDPMFGEAAGALADSTLSAHRSNPVTSGKRQDSTVESGEIATQMFQRLLTRTPTESELTALVNYYEAQKQRLASGDLNPEKLREENGKESIDLLAWKMVARALLNLNETVTKG